MNISFVKRQSGTIILVLVLIALVVLLSVYHLVSLIGVAFLGSLAYGFDHTAGVALNNRRKPPGTPREEKGLFIYERDWWTRIKFVLWSFGLWFGGGFLLGKFGLSNIMEIPAEMGAFIIGIMIGPLVYGAWQRRREFAAKADELERGLKNHEIDPAELVRKTATTVGAGIVAAVSEIIPFGGDSAPAAPEQPVATPPPAVPPKPVQSMSAKDILRRHADGRKP